MKFDNYEPVGLTLKNHQRETILHILKYRRCFVLDDMGTGKTLSSLSACDFLMIHKKIKKVLIVTPLSVVYSTWVNHILYHFPHRSFSIMVGLTKEKRNMMLNQNKEFCIINTDGIKGHEKELIKAKFDIVIIDESTKFSYHTSQRTKSMWNICKYIPSVIPMSGNPIPNDTLQSYAQAKLLDFNRIKYFTKYRDQLKYKLDMFNYIDREDAVNLAYAVLQPSIRHILEDCVDMPPITYKFIDIKLTDDQQRHYLSMEKEYITWLDSGESVTAINAAVRYTKLLQISAGIIIDNEGSSTGIDHKNRLKELDDILSQTSKLVVFANFTESIRDLKRHYPLAEVIDGNVSGKERGAIIDRFQDGPLKMIIAQPRAMNYGVNLQAANTIVWWSPCSSNDDFEQCNRRIRRMTQLRPQFIIMFRSSRTEKKVYLALERKQKVSDVLLNMAKEDTKEEYK